MKRTDVCELGLQLRDEVEHLGLDRRVEPGRRLVEDQQRRVLRERHRDDHALLHAARELVRVAAQHRAGSAICTVASASRRPLGASLRDAPRTVKTSATCAPTRSDGFSAAPGFW